MNIFQNKAIKYLSILMIALFFLLLRVNDFSFFNGNFLWAEDGKIFINQAYSLGWESIITPYTGYLHLYPRLISLIAVGFDISYIPYILTLGWFSAILFSAYIITNELEKHKIHWSISVIIISLIIFQPHSGETFFNITNAQWFLSLSLVVIIVLNDRFKLTIKNLFIMIILGLTGPFSILVLPILIINAFFKKDIFNNWFKYFIVLLTALIQLYFILYSNRITGQIDTNVMHWLKSLYIFFTFGGKGLVPILSLLFWGSVMVYIIRYLKKKEPLEDNFRNGLLIIFTAAIMYMAGLWASKSSLLVLHPLGWGARYFIIPYALMIVSLPLLIKNKKWLVTIFLLLFIIFGIQFTRIHRINLNFQSYAWMSSKVSKINIPINPQWAIFPGWHINKQSHGSLTYNDKNNIAISDILFINAEKLTDEDYNATTNDMEMIMSIPKKCINTKYLGLEVTIKRENDGWAQIFYSGYKQSFTEEHSHKRYYQSGETIMQFAFPNNSYHFLRLDPTNKKEKVTIKKIILYCGE